MRGLSTFTGSGWAYGFTFTPLPPQTLPQIWERWLKSYPLQVCKPCHYTLVEAVESFRLHSLTMAYLYELFERLPWCGWAYGFTLTPLLPQMLPKIWERWLKHYLVQVCNPCHYTFVEVVELFKLHPMSMAYLYEVFERLLRMWMGVWPHTHNLTTTDASPDLGKLAKILPDASVQTMPLCFGLGCRTFQTVSHVHVIHIWSIWEHSQVVDGHMASHSHRYHHRCFPRFRKVG